MTILAAIMPRLDSRYDVRTWSPAIPELSGRKLWAGQVSLHENTLSFFPWKHSSRARWVAAMDDLC